MGRVNLQQSRIRIACAKGIYAIEYALSASIPDVASVEDGIDHRRSVARSYAVNTNRYRLPGAHDQDPVRNPGSILKPLSQNHLADGLLADALRADIALILRTHDPS